MKDQIQLHEIAGYLPYGVRCQYEGILNGAELAEWEKEYRHRHPWDGKDYPDRPAEVIGTKTASLKEVKIYKSYFKIGIGTYPGHLKSFLNGAGFKPILRPLSDLTDEMAIKSGYKNASALKLVIVSKQLPYQGFENLFKHHYDVFNLIGRNLAVDINTLKEDNS